MPKHDLTFPIRTERLTLRPFENADFEALWLVYRDPNVVRFLYTDMWAQRAAEQGLEKNRIARTWQEEGDRLVLAIVPDGAEGPVGEVVLIWRSEASLQGEVGFVLGASAQGKGYAREAAAAMIELGFGTLGLHRIYGRCDARNGASARVMERVGMRREAHFHHDELFKGEWTDTLVFGLLAEEWRRGASGRDSA